MDTLSNKPKNTFYDIYREMVKASTKENGELCKTKIGNYFERLTKVFLETEKSYKKRFKKVMLWNEFNSKYKIGQMDKGIDLVCEQNDGKLVAVQCKCYNPHTEKIETKDVQGFIAECNKKKLNITGGKLFVTTAGEFNENAIELLKDSGRCNIINSEILNKGIDWSNYDINSKKHDLKTQPIHELKKHQEFAFKDVIKHFKNFDRGQLIMACGTGKTFTSLRIAEKLLKNKKNGIVLYLVPSITLITQSMREWSQNTKIEQHYLAVCSDNSVDEGGSTLEINSPVSTNVEQLKKYVQNRPTNKTTIIFSTYHSVNKILDAIKECKEIIDLALCDEAHRTAGIEDIDTKIKYEDKKDSSFFTQIHDKLLPIDKRLYMTATPKIFTEELKGKAAKKRRVIHSMNDTDVFGPVCHELTFTEAVTNYKILSDYKVKIAIIPPGLMNPELQKDVFGPNTNQKNIKHKMSAVWHSILHSNDDTNNNQKLLQRVLVFNNLIKDSKKFKEEFVQFVRDEKVQKHFKTNNIANVEHVDGTTNALNRKSKLKWLEDSNENQNECRLLTNARCLSEGVDVPTLDGIVFMEPRKSSVDVVQSVGRVMRKAKNKDYGYIILPVVIPYGVEPNEYLDNNDGWRDTWKVINALRSHDSKLDIEINNARLTNKTIKKIDIEIIGGFTDKKSVNKKFKKSFEKYHGRVYSKLIEKVGDRDYHENFGKELGKRSIEIENIINNIYNNDNKIRKEINNLNLELKELINENIDNKETIRVISQHMVLSKVFHALFQGKFKTENNMVKSLDSIVESLNIEHKLNKLKPFYEEIINKLKTIDTDEARQNFIKIIYENFFKGSQKYDVKEHGIVYTPIELVDFIIHSVEYILNTNFEVKKSFNDRDVSILDPFTGTGSFITRLLQSKYIHSNLRKKFEQDIRCNEIMLLAYYVAMVNIETTYVNLPSVRKRLEFQNINYTDTLEINPKYHEDPRYREENTKLVGKLQKVKESVRNMKSANINIIFSNPPYAAKYSNSESHKIVKDRIIATYKKRKSTGNTVSLRDSYIKSIRWASDRLGDSGIIAFVTNGSFIRSAAGSGIRRCMEEEFSEIWCFDLRGDASTQGKIRKREGGGIFGAGSKAPVTILFLVKNSKKKDCKVHYKDIGECLTREQKLEKIKKYKLIKGIQDWEYKETDTHGDWLDKRNTEFTKYMPMGSQDGKKNKTNNVLFKIFSLGIKTHRDAYVYHSNKLELTENVKQFIMDCIIMPNTKNRDKKYSKTEYKSLCKIKKIKPKFDTSKILKVSYRPFFKQYLYYDKNLNDSVYKTHLLFPNKNTKNLVINISQKFKGEFSVFMTDTISDQGLISSTQCFPLYYFDQHTAMKKENILNVALKEYQQHYNDRRITKLDIFYYVYGLLHHNGYKEKFGKNLMKEIPHIPMAPNFRQFTKIGKQLANIHINFEKSQKYDIKPKYIPTKFSQLVYDKKSTIYDNDKNIIFDNIPEIRYTVRGRTPLEWIADSYKVKRDDKSNITKDHCKEINESIIDIIQKVVYVGKTSDELIKQLPIEFEPSKDNWKPKKRGLDAHIDGLDQ